MGMDHLPQISNATSFPSLTTNQTQIERAFRIALGDIMGNIAPFQDGLLERPEPVLLAGLDYPTPWTRDAAINVWNGAGLFFPEVARNTLLSVLERAGGGVRIGGQYWDAMIWSLGAWAYYLYTGDRPFLELAAEATRRSLAFFEASELDPALNLFRGPAVYGDGIAAYPSPYEQTGGNSSILSWPGSNPEHAARPGVGLPMMALSTNCVYAQAYRTLAQMAAELGQAADPAWERKAQAMQDAIQRHFWNPKTGLFRYLVDPAGPCEHQEGFGHSFALLFGIATPAQAEMVLRRQPITPTGIPCVWPTFPRYARSDGQTFGRHSGTVWPPVQGFWGEAAARLGRPDRLAFELEQLAEHACRDSQFVEIYHPLTGAPYGGIQEGGGGPDGMQWKSCARQTWSATAFLRLILMGLIGMRFDGPAGIHFAPFLPEGIEGLSLRHLLYRQAILHIILEGPGSRIREFQLNGQPAEPFLPAQVPGENAIHIFME
jgi:glycogen debranching enzyme